MSFIPSGKPLRLIPGSGPKDAKIVVVGEAGGAHENIQLRPFVGPAGGVLEQCLHAAGLTRSEVYLTNVVKLQPKGNDITPFFNGRTFSAEGHEWVVQLQQELDSMNAHVIVACGKTAMAALTGDTRITQLRGYILPSIGLQRVHKVIPTIHPAASLYDRKGGDKGSLTTKEFKPYLYRHVIAADFKKAKAESGSAELVRPQRQLVYEFGNVGEALEWLRYYEEQPLVCFDIEVLNHEIACIGFSSSPDVACSIPLVGQWTEPEEVELWRALQRVLGNPSSIKVGQNLIFDIQFLLVKCGIRVRGPLRDTMIAHSVMFPELPKGLGFLVSIYGGSSAYHKDMIKFDNIKGND